METDQTITEIKARIDRAVQRVVDAVASLTPAEMVDHRFDGGRSVKDILAHLAWWDRWMVYILPPDPETVPNPTPPPLFDEIPGTEHWADEMNARVHAYNQPRDLETILTEFNTAREQLLRRIAPFSLNDLYNPDGISAQIGQPLAPLVLGIYEHYEEHADELEQLL
jgi:hypothetical protein